MTFNINSAKHDVHGDDLHAGACATKTPPTGTLPHRRRIWQLAAGRHCSVLGTCLSMQDLHAIARRARYRIEPDMTAYTLHSWFVDMVGQPNELAKLVDKELEKRHGKVADYVRGARTEPEIEARFKEVVARGQIASAYWGAMSHPLGSEELQWRVFGEVHMLSHLVGSSRRADLARFHDLESAAATLESKLAQMKHDHRDVARERRRAEEELARERRARELAERRLVTMQQKLAERESRSLADELQAANGELERRCHEANARADATAALLGACQAELAERAERAARAERHAGELRAENEALEAELTCALPSASPERDLPGPSETSWLAGKRILCVGGRTNLVPHYRVLVERHGGELVHHDGGLEESLESVTRAMATVDVVLCPVDAVSHAASLKVKRACKHLAKAFVTLRSSGLSSFARSLRALAPSTA